MRVVSLPDWLPKLGELFTDLPGIRGQDPPSQKNMFQVRRLRGTRQDNRMLTNIMDLARLLGD